MFSKTRHFARVRQAGSLAARLRDVNASLLLVLVLIIAASSGAGVFA